MNNTQTITRKDLRYFYENACDGWKIKIGNLLLDQAGQTIKVETSFIKEGYNAASDAMKKRLEEQFDIFAVSKLFKVKDYSDFCKVVGIKELTEKDFANSRNPKKALAFEQIKTIEEFYNDGWKPDFADRNQQKHYPYFINEKGSWRFDGSGCCYGGWYGDVGLYKDQQTSDFVGKTFMKIYLQVI